MSTPPTDHAPRRRAGASPSVSRSWWSAELLGLAAIVVGLAGIAGTTFRRPNTDAEVIALTAFVACMVFGISVIAGRRWSLEGVRIAAGIGVGAVIASQALPDFDFFRIRVFTITALAAVLLAGIALVRRAIPRRWAAVVAVGAVVVVGAASISVVGGETPDVDVVQLHEQAVRALQRGDNPYSTGSVSVLETKLYGDNELIEEYTYPPINLVWYAIGDGLNGDVRVGGAVALVAAVAIFAGVALHRADRDDGLVGTAALAGTALLISNQAMYLMVSYAWTEVTALPFFFLAFAWWRRLPVASAVALGLALASKQYFVLALPVLVLLPDPWRVRRTVIASCTAVATLLPFLLWDARGLIDGLVVHHLTRDARPDAMTWANLGIEVPSAIAALAAVGVGIWIARRAGGAGLAAFALASTFGVFTLLAVRGFVNSWWLVFCLVSVGLVLPTRADELLDERTGYPPARVFAPGRFLKDGPRAPTLTENPGHEE